MAGIYNQTLMNSLVPTILPGFFNKSVKPSSIKIDQSWIAKQFLVSQYQILISFQTLKKNWNGNNADPIDKEVIDHAFKIISLIDVQPEIFPTARNSVQIEYNISNTYVEFEIFSDKILYLTDKENNLKEGIIKESEIPEFIKTIRTNE